MQSFLPTIVLRHHRENLKKCSLRGLESREDFVFFTYPQSSLPDLSRHLMLAIDAPPLTSADVDRGLFVLDATWRYAGKMMKFVESSAIVEARSIPDHYRTAYPRRQDDCPFPGRGLASIEAIYIAYHILGHNVEGLLDGYHWKEQFFQLNPEFLTKN